MRLPATCTPSALSCPRPGTRWETYTRPFAACRECGFFATADTMEQAVTSSRPPTLLRHRRPARVVRLQHAAQ